jgi:hypothetical protein
VSTEDVAKNITEELYKPFPREMEKSINKGGRNLTYIPASEVVNRLNRVFGVDGWESETVNQWRDGDTIVAHVRLTAYFPVDGHVGQDVAYAPSRKSISHDGFGGVAIKFGKGSDTPVDLGDEYKGAASDALKKAATLFGVALYLARSEEALDAEAVEDAAAAPYVPTEKDVAWENFMGVSKKLNADAKKTLGAFWKQHLSETERPADTKPIFDNVNMDDINALAGEALRLTLNGQYVDEPSAP